MIDHRRRHVRATIPPPNNLQGCDLSSSRKSSTPSSNHVSNPAATSGMIHKFHHRASTSWPCGCLTTNPTMRLRTQSTQCGSLWSMAELWQFKAPSLSRTPTTAIVVTSHHAQSVPAPPFVVVSFWQQDGRWLGEI